MTASLQYAVFEEKRRDYCAGASASESRRLHAKIHLVKNFQAFFTAHAGEIVLTVIFGIRLIFSRKKLGYRLFIFGILFALLFVLDNVELQEFNPLGNLNLSSNIVTTIFLALYALYVLFFEHD